MNKKLIQVTPPLGTKKAGKRMTVQIIEDILVLNLYEDKVLKCRYAMNKEGTQYATYINDKWGQRRLECVASKYAYCCSVRDVEDYKVDTWKQQEMLVSFWEKESAIQVFQKISHNEWNINQEKSQRAYDRKVERIENMVANLPLVPDETEQWVKDNIFKEQYMFYSKEKDCYKCTACGKPHYFKRKMKHNEKVLCKRSNVWTEVKKRNIQDRERTENITVIQKVPDKDVVVTKIMKARCTWCGCKQTIELYSEILLIKEAQKPKTQILYGQWSQRDEFEQSYWTTNPASKRYIYKNLYVGNLRQDVQGTCFESLGYILQDLQYAGYAMNYSVIVDQYKWIAKLEYLVKAKLYEIVEDILRLYRYWEYGTFSRGRYCISAKTVEAFLQINMQRVHRLKQNTGGICFLEWLQWEEKNGKTIKDTAIKFMDKAFIEPCDYAFIQDRMSVVQFVNYIQKQMNMQFYKEEHTEPKDIISDWKDYLNMSEKLNYPVMDEIVYKPTDLAKRHAQRVSQALENDLQEQCIMLNEKYPNTEAFLRECKEKYEYQGDEYEVVIPATVMEIEIDGAKLKHCVATSEIYFERMNKRESFIGFVRKRSCPEESYYTLEIQPGGNIRQQRTFFNRQTGLDAIRGFLKEYQREIKKNLNEKDINMAKESTRLHLANLKMLKASPKQRDNELAEILETDYMEAV